MILFHHRAKLAAGDGFAPPQSPSKGDVLLVRRPGKELVEPEVVATSPCRIKSPMPVCCGFDSVKMESARAARARLMMRRLAKSPAVTSNFLADLCRNIFSAPLSLPD